MKGYVFTRGVDGFGADVAPAYEEGCYLDYDKAFKHLCELNDMEALKECGIVMYEKGYGADYYPDDNMILRQAEEEDDEELWEKEMSKHIITDTAMYCKRIMEEWDEPPIGLYRIEEIEIKE